MFTASSPRTQQIARRVVSQWSERVVVDGTALHARHKFIDTLLKTRGLQNCRGATVVEVRQMSDLIAHVPTGTRCRKSPLIVSDVRYYVIKRFLLCHEVHTKNVEFARHGASSNSLGISA